MSVLPADLSVPYILSLLTTHDWDDCVNFFGEDQIQVLAPDLEGFITLNANKKEFTIDFVNPPPKRNESKWTFERPGSEVFERCCIN
jgi:hypothetical protein